ncbi:MAG: hypothetical protein JWP08_3682, partial [Bryobacterales bacterium]|nr:hypothetical protein [Bryobacterales bacterium]
MGEKSRFLAILAALLAAAFRVASVSPETKESEHQKALAKAAAERKADPANALLQTFSDFDKGYVYISPLLKSGTCASLPRNRSSRPMDWAVATVPDPERSNLKLDFDRQLEAIQNAAESAGYQFERFWFPWHSEQAALPALDKLSEGAQAAETSGLPGVLLFRQPGKDSSRVPGLAIFLVGETPTSGINPAQFRYAACLGSSLHQAETEHSALHIIGPGYSASFDSLAALAKNYDQLTVRSWTSDLNSQQQFRMQMGGRGSQLDLKTTRTSSVVSINSFVAFLRREWREMGPIVLLKEAGTALGSGIKPPKPCAASRSETTLLDIEDCKVFLIEFPRNLSTLRNATESEGHAEGAVDPKSGMPRIGLTLSLRTERASYEIPRFSEA